MGRIKYGIDLGTTNSAIAVIDKGESAIIKSEVQKDTIPSCVGFNKKKSISTALMRENPVSSPNVPPTVESLSVKVAATSFVTSSNAGVSI